MLIDLFSNAVLKRIHKVNKVMDSAGSRTPLLSFGRLMLACDPLPVLSMETEKIALTLSHN